MPTNKFEDIKNYYNENLPRLLKEYPRMSLEEIIILEMNTIERMALIELKNFGLPFLPQFPIDKFFADFADPIKKIVIEIDGKKWHTKEKDDARDLQMQNLGYKVYRFEAWLVAQEMEEIIDIDGGEEVIDDFKEKIMMIKKAHYDI